MLDNIEKDVLQTILKQHKKYKQLLSFLRKEEISVKRKYRVKSLSSYSAGRRGYILASKIRLTKIEFQNITIILNKFVCSLAKR